MKKWATDTSPKRAYGKHLAALLATGSDTQNHGERLLLATEAPSVKHVTWGVVQTEYSGAAGGSDS